MVVSDGTLWYKEMKKDYTFPIVKQILLLSFMNCLYRSGISINTTAWHGLRQAFISIYQRAPRISWREQTVQSASITYRELRNYGPIRQPRRTNILRSLAGSGRSDWLIWF